MSQPNRPPETVAGIVELLSLRVELRLGPVRCRGLITYGALLDCEQATGVNMLACGEELLRPSARFLRGLAWAALHRAGFDCTLEQTGDLFGPEDILPAQASLMRAWAASMPEPGGEQGPAAKSWMECWAFARSPEGLGLTDEQWREMTPRMARALAEERLEGIRQRELMLSKVAAAVVNYGMCAPEKMVDDERFMSHPWPKKAVAAGVTPASGDAFMQFIKIWNGTHGKQK